MTAVELVVFEGRRDPAAQTAEFWRCHGCDLAKIEGSRPSDAALGFESFSSTVAKTSYADHADTSQERVRLSARAALAKLDALGLFLFEDGVFCLWWQTCELSFVPAESPHSG